MDYKPKWPDRRLFTRAQRLRQLDDWVSQHASILRSRDGDTQVSHLRQRGDLPQEAFWYKFLYCLRRRGESLGVEFCTQTVSGKRRRGQSAVLQRPQPPAKLALDNLRNVRPCVRKLFTGLLEFQRTAPGKLPGRYGEHKDVFWQIQHVRKLYRGKRHRPLTAQEGELLTAVDPNIFGKGVLGKAAKHGSVWRWTFEYAGYDVHSDDFDSEEEATAELLLLQSRLYPGWEKENDRMLHLGRLRDALRQQRAMEL